MMYERQGKACLVITVTLAELVNIWMRMSDCLNFSCWTEMFDKSFQMTELDFLNYLSKLYYRKKRSTIFVMLLR